MRPMHLVGSMPAPDASAAMRQALDSLGDGLLALPDGETGQRFHWIIHIVESLRTHPDLELASDGRWTNYDDLMRFRIRKGHKLRGETLDFGHVKAFEESYPNYRDARPRGDLPFQVGIPGDMDMALFVLGPPGPLRHRRPFTDATVKEITAIHAQAGDDVLFQLEIPVELVAVARAPKPAQPALARLLGRGVANLAKRSPAGARFGIHLCLGDMNHRALASMRDTAPLVALANAIAASWPARRPLEFVHAPFAAAEVPPSTAPRWYAPLDGLKLGPSTRFIAGFAHEDQPLDDQRFVQQLIERSLGVPVAVSTACGLGRRTPEAAERALKRVRELAG